MKKNWILLFILGIISICCKGQNVGIGISSPLALLHIRSTSAVEMFFL